jgi:hypothetical protein
MDVVEEVLVLVQAPSEAGREGEGHRGRIIGIDDEMGRVQVGEEDREEEEGGVMEEVRGEEVEGTVVAAPGEGEDDGGHVLRAQACFQGDAVLGGREGGREGGKDGEYG